MNPAPATTQPVAAPSATVSAVRAQVALAAEAQRAWAAKPVAQRLAVLRRFRHALAERAPALDARFADPSRPGEFVFSQLMPLADAVQFLEREAARILRPQRHGARSRSLLHAGVGSVVMREPLGTVLVVGPSNYPFFLPGVQVVQALAAGNAVALKPGNGGTAAAETLRALLVSAGLDARLLQVLPEDITSVDAALDAAPDARIAKVFLTGSATTGQSLLAKLAPRLIPATMELSGCDAMLVLADADPDLAARAAAFGLRLNNGATCIAPRRAIVHHSLIEQFEARLHALLENAPLQNAGDPLAARLASLFRDAEAHGGHFLVGGLSDGIAQLPAVVSFRSTGAALLDADVFAPVMSLLAADSDEHALQLAAQCSYGLGASIFSRDPARAAALARALPVGVVTINDVIAPTADARLPFGGRLRSGFGVTRGAEGLLEMTAPKVVAARAGRFRPHYFPPAAADGELALHLMQSAHGGGLLQRLRSRLQLLRVVLRRAANRPKPHPPS